MSDAPANHTKEEIDEEEIDDVIDYAIDELGFATGILDKEQMDELAPSGEWEWEFYQQDYLEEDGFFICNKGRQMGMSTAFAVKSLARAILGNKRFNAVTVSYKKEEAQQKIQIAKDFLSTLPPRFRKEIIRDPLHLIEFKNPNGTKAKIMSHAQREPRGVDADLVQLDEFAIMTFAKKIYEAALPAITAKKGVIEAASTPLGTGGKFYEIMENPKRFPQYNRMKIMWYNCRRYLKEPSIEFQVKAEKQAPRMDVEDAVFKFGNQWIRQQFKNSDLDTFKQEFCAFFLEEDSSFFSRDFILNTMYKNDPASIDDYDPREEDFSEPIEDALKDTETPIVHKYPNILFKRYDDLENLYEAIASGEVGRNLIAGADIGATKHATSFKILEEIMLDGGQTLQVERFSLNRNDWPLRKQQSYFEKILNDGFVSKFYMDATGIGSQMGEYLEDQFGKDTVRALQLGGSSKKVEKLMTNLRARMESGGLALAHDRRTVDDLFSIKRVITKTGGISYRADDNKKHHGDSAYALALASIAGTEFGKEASVISSGKVKNFDLKKIRQRIIQSSKNNSSASKSSLVSRSKKERLNNLGKKEDSTFNKLSDPGGFINNYEEM